MNATSRTLTFDDIPTSTSSSFQDTHALPIFISGLIGIPFVIVFLITLVVSGNSTTAFKAAFVVILVGLLIGFGVLTF